MVKIGKANFFKRKDGKYLIYLPKDLVEDSSFPFKDFKQTKKGALSIAMKVTWRNDPCELVLSPMESE